MSEKSILLVEDNPDDEELTLRAFRKNNILNEIVVARDGDEALQMLVGTNTNPERTMRHLPAIILLDLNLPKVDGLGVLKVIRSHPTTLMIPVIVLTSSKEDQDVLKSYALGCNSYVRKPVDFSQFLEATRQLGLYWLVLNEPPPQMP